MNKEREEWIDILRGIAVFMVILGHLYTGYAYHLVANPIKMPVFYFIAGYVTTFKKSIKQLIAIRLRTLFIPMFVFSLFPVRALYYLLFRQDINLLVSYAKGFADGSINWFIYSFFVSTILFTCLYMMSKGNLTVFGTGSAICFLIGYITKDVNFMDIWCFNTALTSLIFMFFGYLSRIHQCKYMDKKWFAIICFILYCVLLVISFMFYNGKTINFHLCEYYSVFICGILIITGIIAERYILKVLCLFFRDGLMRFLIIFGQNTIVVYLASSTFNAIILRFFRNYCGLTSLSFIYCFAAAIISCLLGCFVSITCKKYAPILLGDCS